MFNTVALILRPDEIRLFIVLIGALVSTALAAIVRALRRILAQVLQHVRRGIPAPIARVCSGPIAAGLGISMSAESRLARARITDGLGRLMCRWSQRRALRPPH